MPQKKEQKLVLGGFFCRLVRSSRKTLQLAVEQDGALTIRSPYRMPLKIIESFLLEKKDWILSQREKAAARLAKHPRHTFCQGETVYFLGKPLHIMLKDGKFPPYRKKGDLFLSSERPEAQVVEWFREHAKRMLTPRVAELAKQYGFSFSGVRITSAKGRYGSCNHKNGINLSWRIVMAPLETVDAVILHELCHTREHNHSSRFWTLLSSVCPDYDGCCRWLREHGLELVSFG